MLRIHFSDADLARTRVAAAPDPLWEITTSLYRLQMRRGRTAYAAWYRTARRRLHEEGLEQAVRKLLLPLHPVETPYFPDFLTPIRSEGGLAAGLEAVRDTDPSRIIRETRLLDRAVGAPSWAPRLAEQPMREDLTRVLRAYHDAVIAPHWEQVQSRIEAERAACCRTLMGGGIEGMLANLSPTMRWKPPVLHVKYPMLDQELHLDGRGLLLIPSYFTWNAPVSLADPRLPPILCYPLHHPPPDEPHHARTDSAAKPLTALLGRARAVALLTAANGATNAEIARAAGISTSSASRHATVLRDAGLITSSRLDTTTLHTLTPAGARLLQARRQIPPAQPDADHEGMRSEPT
ncbi:ArsR/SmtB family transcription factor [Streptomyces albidoflavus]